MLIRKTITSLIPQCSATSGKSISFLIHLNRLYQLKDPHLAIISICLLSHVLLAFILRDSLFGFPSKVFFLPTKWSNWAVSLCPHRYLFMTQIHGIVRYEVVVPDYQ